MTTKTTIKWDQEAINAMQTGPQKRLVKIGLEMEGDIKRSFTSGGTKRKASKQTMATGEIFKRKGKEMARSAPGQPPAVDTGRLRASITTNWTDSRKNTGKDGVSDPGGDQKEFKVVVGTNVEYGRHLELGTRKMKPRPYLTPAFERFRGKIVSMLKGSATGRVATE